MAVGPATPLEFSPVAGVRLAAVASGIRYPDRLDLVLVELAETATVAGVFTRNLFCAAPVLVAKDHLAAGSPRFFLINTGNANAGTGSAGIAAAQACCQRLAELTGIRAEQVLPFSTGVIGEQLPFDRILQALPQALAHLAPDQWPQAAQGIMTTDTRPKLLSRQLQLAGRQVTITGIAKGSGMIRPDMATMLSFVATDAALDPPHLQRLLGEVTAVSFNRITVDGDTSTNDAAMLAATGVSGWRWQPDRAEGETFRTALQEVFQGLARELIRDAEGATKFITIKVSGGASQGDCLQVAYCIAESPLVKTAFFASDPNWGRILAAIGRAGVALDLATVTIALGQTTLVRNGGPDPDYSEARGQQEMAADEITIGVDLGMGDCSESVWTSDLSHDYVRINAEYRS